MSTKEITITYNGYDIQLEIDNDYKLTLENIKKKLYLQDEDLKNMYIYYFDEDGDENEVEEDNFDEAYKFMKWVIHRNDQNKNEKKINEEESEKDKKNLEKHLKEKLKEKLKKEINEKIKQKIEELKSNFTKIANEKIMAIISKYEKKIQDLNDIIKQLNEKNKIIIQENNKIQESSLETIIEYAKQQLEEHIEQLDNNIFKNEEHQNEVNNNNNNK